MFGVQGSVWTGGYDVGWTADANTILSNLLNAVPESAAPSWLYEFLLDVQGEHAASAQARLALSLCHSYAIFQSVLDRFNHLVSWKFCTDFFSILVLRDNDTAEVVEIPRTILVKITETLLASISVAREETEENISRLILPVLQELCDMMGWRVRAMPSNIPEACRVLTYFLDLGLVCYAGSHGSRFDIEYFGRTIERISANVAGVLGFECTLRSLACLNGFLDTRSVWTFTIFNGAGPPRPREARFLKPLSILTTIRALADIWGPVSAELTDHQQSGIRNPRVKKYVVSKGCIRRVPDRAGSSGSRVVKCHWYSWQEEQRRRLSRFFSGSRENLTMALDDKLLIGTNMSVNHGCTFSLQEYEMNYNDKIREAGPRPSRWKFDGLAMSLQVAAQGFVVLQIEGQTKRLPETTVKESAWQKWSSNPERANPGILNSYYGVEISNCTGNARRVPLKELLLKEPVMELLERQVPGWASTKWGLDFKKALEIESNDAVFEFWNKHYLERPLVGRLVSSVLDVLDHTGLTDAGFQAAFLHENCESVIELETKANDWAELLKDSYLTATYAIINAVCLEYRRPDHTTSICTDEQRYSVLQTELVVEKAGDLDSYNHVKVKPHGSQFKKVDLGAEGRLPPHFMEPVSNLQMVRRLTGRYAKAKELVYQRPHDSTGQNKVILRASRPSFGGMTCPRNRKLLTAAADHSTNTLSVLENSLATQEALSQLEIEAILREDLENLDREEDRQAIC
ncbi:uncharacterized protein B0I36DRAFT_347689 [Microdochium trichocladiopsis]|uniref:Uncharacterized protein n=1 Tax=Microdochium trichocladiopsis TaxID=1682393 RepID=A0A9P8YFC5_9PEZI|nr:uncharacterized protein B0I36DRAFT_347689 [Microdochium trichocladiopsis]KAH7035982.1 hypothetical protein B0I36DRAFT_347689 [Microdochium trichocladiopsis]